MQNVLMTCDISWISCSLRLTRNYLFESKQKVLRKLKACFFFLSLLKMKLYMIGKPFVLSTVNMRSNFGFIDLIGSEKFVSLHEIVFFIYQNVH